MLIQRKHRTRWTILAVFLLLLMCRKHIRAGIPIALEPFTFSFGDKSFLLSSERDDFDITFAKYPSTPDASTVNDTSYLVPPIIHNIFLGPKPERPEWDEAGQACKRQHPGYTFEFWDDARAEEFVKQEYPHTWPLWKAYKFTIQRADSLRYMILYKYGGIFLDLDLHCSRPLTPIRKFEFVAAAAYPAGISNGFMMAKPRLPFVKRLIDNLPKYNLSWFGLPYLTVSFSTGCHYLSTIHATETINRTNLRVLWGPNRLHQLNGNASTPIFHHLGSSSWHSYDAAFFNTIGKPGKWGSEIHHHKSSGLLISFASFVFISVFVLIVSRTMSAIRLSSANRKH